MPRQSRPCWDSTNNRWRTRIAGKTYILGGESVPYATILERHARLYRERTGLTIIPDPPPITVAELVTAWLKAEGLFSSAPLREWPRKARWRRDNLFKWIEFCESIDVVAVDEIAPDNLKRFTDYCRARGWTRWTTRRSSQVSFPARAASEGPYCVSASTSAAPSPTWS